MIEYDLDTARAAESLLVGGTPARFPDVRFIFSHSGGALPTLAARMIDDYPKNRANLLPNGVEYEIRKFYYEVAHASKVPALDALKDIAPISQILFGSDVPIRNYELTTEGLEHYGGIFAGGLGCDLPGQCRAPLPPAQDVTVWTVPQGKLRGALYVDIIETRKKRR